MGILLAPFFLLHLWIFVFAIKSIYVRVTNKNDIKITITLSLLIALFLGGLMLFYNFDNNQNSRIYAFEILLDLACGGFTILILFVTLLLHFFIKSIHSKFYFAVLYGVLMAPQFSIISWFVFAEKLKLYYGITYHY